MKKFISLLSTALFVITLAVCSNAESSTSASGSDNAVHPNTETAQTTETEPAASDSNIQTDSASDGKALVVYFSASGNTKRVAELAAEELDADLFELVPADPYTEDDQNWRDQNSRVCVEHEDVSLQDIELVSTEVPDWSEYNVVLFGYPLWWREAAWPVNRFVKNNDFTGKRVITFCTSTSNDLGDSGKHLAEMAGTGEWTDGNRFPETADEESIREWARSLDPE